MKSLFVLLILFMGVTQELPFPKYAVKKIDKALEEVWPEQSTALRMIDFYDEDLKHGTDQLKLFKVINNNDQLLGYMVADQAPSQHDRFDFGIIFNTQFEIEKALILIYREDYGGEIGSKRWLRQFENKSSSSPIQIGEDITGISGATISCGSATESIRNWTNWMIELKEKGII